MTEPPIPQPQMLVERWLLDRPATEARYGTHEAEQLYYQTWKRRFWWAARYFHVVGLGTTPAEAYAAFKIAWAGAAPEPEVIPSDAPGTEVVRLPDGAEARLPRQLVCVVVNDDGYQSIGALAEKDPPQ